jgi:PAS domain S-box-containing protein
MSSFRRCIYNTIAIILFALGASFVLWQLIDREQLQNNHRFFTSDARRIQLSAQDFWANRIKGLEMARAYFLIQETVTLPQFARLSEQITQDFEGYQALAYLDAQGRVIYTFPQNSKEAGEDLNLNNISEFHNKFIKSKETKTAVATSPYPRGQRNSQILLLLPIHQRGLFKGAILRVFKVENIVQILLGKDIGPNYFYDIADEHNHSIYSTFDPRLSLDSRYKYDFSLSFADTHWWLTLYPKNIPSSSYPRTILTALILFLSGIFIVLIWNGYFNQKRFKNYADSLEAEGERLAEKSLQLRQVLEATRILNTEHSPHALLNKITEMARNLVHADHAALGILSKQGHLDQFVSRGIEREVVERLHASRPVKKEIIKAIWEEKQIIIIEDTMPEQPPEGFMGGSPPTHNFLGIPIASRDKILGNIYLYKSGPQGSFTQEDEDILVALAAGAAVALENVRLYGNIEDIARQLSAEVLRQKQYAENVLQSIADGVYTTNKDKIILSWSKGAQTITGFTAQDAIGNRCQDFLKHCDEEGNLLCKESCPVSECLEKSNLILSKHVWISTKSGKQISVAVSTAPIFDPSGETIGVVEVFRDITREKEIDRMKTEFISTVSHELRTPLTSIKGSLQLLLRKGDGLGASQKNLLDICLRNTDRLVRLINDILDLTKIEAGKMAYRPEPWDLTKIVDAAVSGIQAMAHERKVTVEIMISPALPQVLCDFDRLTQVMINLLSNAVKFSPPESKIYLEATPEEEDQCVEVSIRDQGPGIAPDDLNKLFKKFQRVGDITAAGGTGLGLAICKAIIEEHGGSIWAESSIGQGSRFAFILPIKP